MTGNQIIICCKQLFYCIFPVSIVRHSVLELEKVHWVEDSGVADNDRREENHGRNNY